MASIEDLKSLISSKGGASRSNLFKVILQPLAGVTTDELNIICRDVQLPGRQILTRERIIGLQTRKIAYGFAQEDVSMTFLLLNDYGAKRYFELWQNLAINQQTFEIGYKKDYSRPVSIYQLDQLGRTVYKCDLLEAFPTTINAIPLNNEENGLVEVNVQLSYTNWIPTYYENPAPTITPSRLDVDLSVNVGPFNINLDIV